MNLGFGNSVVDDIFFVPGYDIRGFVVSQVNYLFYFFNGQWLHRVQLSCFIFHLIYIFESSVM